VKKIPVEGEAKEIPERVKWGRIQ